MASTLVPTSSRGSSSSAISGVTVTGTAASGMVPVASSSSSGTWAVLPGTLLATQNYAPGVLAQYSVVATLTALDTTNATLAFTVPANGAVDIQVFCNIAVITATNQAIVGLGLLNHSGGAQIGNTLLVLGNTSASSEGIVVESVTRFHLTGLTPGALQVDLAASHSGTTSVCLVQAQAATGNASASPAGNPLLIQAFAA